MFGHNYIYSLEGYPTICNQIDIRWKVIDLHEKMEGVFTNTLLISTCIKFDILLDFATWEVKPWRCIIINYIF
jgi:hypothetical protein